LLRKIKNSRLKSTKELFIKQLMAKALYKLKESALQTKEIIRKIKVVYLIKYRNGVYILLS